MCLLVSSAQKKFLQSMIRFSNFSDNILIYHNNKSLTTWLPHLKYFRDFSEIAFLVMC